MLVFVYNVVFQKKRFCCKYTPVFFCLYIYSALQIWQSEYRALFVLCLPQVARSHRMEIDRTQMPIMVCNWIKSIDGNDMET